MTFFESSSRFSFLFEHDLFRKPLHTFRDHALARLRRPGSHDMRWPATTTHALASGHASSPDPDPILRLEVELVARFHAPGVIPGIDVAHWSVDPEAPGRMGIGGDLLLERIWAALFAPALGPTEEHALYAGETVEDGVGRT